MHLARLIEALLGDLAPLRARQRQQRRGGAGGEDRGRADAGARRVGLLVRQPVAVGPAALDVGEERNVARAAAAEQEPHRDESGGDRATMRGCAQLMRTPLWSAVACHRFGVGGEWG